MMYSTCLALLNTTEASSWMLAPFTALDSTVEASVKVCLMLSIALEKHNFQVTKRESRISTIYLSAKSLPQHLPGISLTQQHQCTVVVLSSCDRDVTRLHLTEDGHTATGHQEASGTRSPWASTYWSPDHLPRWPRRWVPVVSGPSRGHVRGGTLCTGTRRLTGGHWRPSQLLLIMPGCHYHQADIWAGALGDTWIWYISV